ncbi:MAG: glycine--tRNA ligase subunit beta [Chloroflexi bacterium]|nr:MAG: glycine--tRNA ligase subunit beta [Chloroflexota bacterium]
MTQSQNFQSIILALQHFWADRGCLIWQPYYTQVGAGTMNPATFLRVLGPEPWNVAYVEPSVRPDDARYGENPNRMQMHYQFQVILKPDPGNPQELYLKSLEAVGIDPRKHDIRFVEDNWESPALGAWGLGWEVWLDGQEITQYTYFQQAGGQVLDPVSVEITYGLDRIAIALQRVRGFTEIRWNDRFTQGDVNLQAEREHSKYYFEVADVERQRQLYELYESEARACISHNLVLPATDYLLKCSHTFNVLDTRGAIGVTERQAFFGRMRDISRQISELYLGERQRLEYPWLEEQGIGDKGDENGKHKASSVVSLTSMPYPLSPSPFLLEIGTEELPAGDLDAALRQLNERVPVLFKELHLEHGTVTLSGTPRRLVVQVQDLSPNQPDREEVVKGPPASRAYDAGGAPTKAAEGFARSRGVALADLQVREIDGGSYVVATVSEKGRPAAEVLAKALPGLIGSLRFDKAMRWNQTNVPFSRPIRWLLALLGDQGVPFSFAGLTSGSMTRGLRFNEPSEFEVQTQEAYFDYLEKQGIILDPDQRKRVIWAGVEKTAEEAGGSIRSDPGLLAEVNNLVEAPAVLHGSFDRSYLDLPGEVLISVMKKHQRYFPVYQRQTASEQEAKLLPYFIAVRNGDHEGMDLVIEGNDHVIRARFADAAFFIKDDLKRPLESYLPRLGTLMFQVKLGSMLDKTNRIVSLVDELSPQIGLAEEADDVAHRAAELCKADLATKMVVEMTSLQGIIGRYYALHSGEAEAVAQAIFEYYLPRTSGDILPSSRTSLLVGIADRLDTLMGLFAAGMAPTGAKDPFAQRRAALGLVQGLIGLDVYFDLRLGLDAAANTLPIQSSPESKAACLEFIVERLRNLLLENGKRHSVVDAVLEEQGYNPARAAAAVDELEKWVVRPDWHTILPAYARCVRITRDQKQVYEVKPDAFVEPAEKDLYAALQKAEAVERSPSSVDDLLNAFMPMIPAIDRFFEEVLVMTEEAELRSNRLGMLQRIAALADGVADLSKLEGF